MSDKERLNLLKEVAGTKVYEQKRAESTRIMEETGEKLSVGMGTAAYDADAKRDKITDLLTYIEDRLTELEEEKQELSEYQTQDRERRCLEFALHDRELEEVTAALEGVEEERRNDVHESNEKRKEFNQREEVVQVSAPTAHTTNANLM